MTPTQLCPDDLVAAARSGSLSATDEARLALHVAGCPRCRAVLEVGRDFDLVLGAQVGDDAIANRIAGGLTRPKVRRWAPYAAGVALALTGPLAVAAVRPGAWDWLTKPAASDLAPSGLAPPERVPVRSQQTRELRAAEPSPRAPEVGPNSIAPPENLAGVPSREKLKIEGQRSSEPLRPLLSARELFAEANALRTQGKGAAAERRYAELQARYPNTHEARVSLVSLGRFKLGSRPSEALRHFDAYLAQKAHTTLTEEALFGRARALSLLGRSSEEHAAWETLLKRFPDSVYAERARARLAAIP